MFIRTIRKLSRQEGKQQKQQIHRFQQQQLQQHLQQQQQQAQQYDVDDIIKNTSSPLFLRKPRPFPLGFPDNSKEEPFPRKPQRLHRKTSVPSRTDRLGISGRKTSLPSSGAGQQHYSSSPSSNFNNLTTDGAKQKLSSISIQGKGGNSGSFSSQSKFIMPPISEDLAPEIKRIIESHAVVIFSKTTCPFCAKAKDLFKSLNVEFKALELDTLENGPKYQTTLKDMTGQNSVPNIFIHGQHLGGCDNLLKMHSENKLADVISKRESIKNYDYDLVVIGGGSGGLALAKEAATMGQKVTLFDFVTPSPPGTTWGLGGTCVNVGCIPKKLMHRASILGEDMEDARQFGWEFSEKVNHSWKAMKDNVQDHIGSLNWGYRVALKDKKVNYVNAYAEILDNNTVKGIKKNKQEVKVTTQYICIATGERPRYPDIPGAREYCITSDDLFSLPYSPGKTLCIGASYVSLECAGFLAGMGLDTTVMVRSILLRGFDQQCAERIGNYMERNKVKFIRGAVPTKIEQIEAGQPGRYKVTSKTTSGEEIVEEYNTILLAIGRDPCTSNIGLENIGVVLNDKSKRVIVNEAEQTNVPNVFAIGDIGEGRPELTPVAIKAGRMLARRLFQPKDSPKKMMDYLNIATTVFTPLEYGCIGYSEEAAIEAFGEDNIEVYHSFYQPLEWTLPHKDENTCYAKLVCRKDKNEQVVGFHILGPNAGEITQGYAVAMRKGVTKEDFDDTVGIHPTNSEVFTTLRVTKRSGETAEVTGC